MKAALRRVIVAIEATLLLTQGIQVQLMKKDMTLAIEAAKQVDAKLVLGEAGLSAYAAASDDPRCRDKDSRVVYRWCVRVIVDSSPSHAPMVTHLTGWEALSRSSQNQSVKCQSILRRIGRATI